MSLSAQLLLAALIVAVTVLFHLTGLSTLLALLERRSRSRGRTGDMIAGALAVTTAAFGLFALHTAEIWTWAAVYRWLEVLPDWEQALYFSTSTYVTVGYGDIVLRHGSRILGAIEGANGIILLGWSTAFFFGIVDRLKLLERELEKRVPSDRSGRKIRSLVARLGFRPESTRPAEQARQPDNAP